MRAAIVELGGFVRRGYDRWSIVALVLLVMVGSSVGYEWQDLLDVNADMDWLLAGTWIWMAAMLCWRVAGRRDLLMIAVGLCGGAVIEWWGTNTLLWTYFTHERPPLWILPAWPIAALAIDRMAAFDERLLDVYEQRRGALSERTFRIAYWLILPLFVVGMTRFLWRSIEIPASMVVVGLMVAVVLSVKDPRRDVVLFVAGTSMGVFLEYWGTSRQCWTYYTHEVPPPIAVFAHGFAAIAFQRAHGLAEQALSRLVGRDEAQRARAEA